MFFQTTSGILFKAEAIEYMSLVDGSGSVRLHCGTLITNLSQGELDRVLECLAAAHAIIPLPEPPNEDFVDEEVDHPLPDGKDEHQDIRGRGPYGFTTEG